MPREEVAHHLSDLAVPDVSLVVHAPHLRLRDGAGQAVEGGAQLRARAQDRAPRHGHRLVGREEAPIVLELRQPELVDQAVGRVARDQVNLAAGERAVGERQIHLPRRRGEAQPVSPREARVTVLTRHEILPEARAPARRVPRRVRDRPQPEPPRLVTAHQDRERVVEAERREPLRVEPRGIALLDAAIDLARVGQRRLLEDRHQRRPRVLDVDVDLAREQRAVAEVAAELEAALDPQPGPPLDRLRDQLAEDHLLGEVLRPDGDARARAAARPAREPDPRPRQEQHPGRRRDPFQGPQRALGAARRERLLQSPKREVGRQRHERGRNRAGQEQRVVVHPQATEDVHSEPACADRRRDRRRPHRDHRRHAHARDDEAERQRQLDLREHLPPGHPHRLGCLADAPVDPVDPGESVADDREQRVEEERDDRRQAPDPVCPEQRDEEAEERQARHRLQDIGRGQDRPLEPRPPRQQDADRDAEKHPRPGRDDHQQHVLCRQLERLVAVPEKEVDEVHGARPHSLTNRRRGPAAAEFK